MTAAARALHVAQPALSRAVKAVEVELGFEVFLRVGRGCGSATTAARS